METFWGSRDGADSSGDSACLPVMWLMFDSGPNECHALYVGCWFSLCCKGCSPGSSSSSFCENQHLQIPIQAG